MYAMHQHTLAYVTTMYSQHERKDEYKNVKKMNLGKSDEKQGQPNRNNIKTKKKDNNKGT